MNGAEEHSPGCHCYEPDDFALELQYAENQRARSGALPPTRSDVELWYPGAEQKLQMPTRGEFQMGYPQGAVIHATEGRSLKGDYDAENTIEFGKSRHHAYFCISNTGKVYQTHPLNRWGSHAGETFHPDLGEWLSSSLVGIEVAAAGIVHPHGDGYKPQDFTEIFSEEQVHKAHKYANVTQEGYYVKFTAEQERSLRNLLLWLHRNNPEVFKLEYVLGHDEVAVYKGRLGRKQDPGGGLSMSMPDYRCHLEDEAAGGPTRRTVPPSARQLESTDWGWALYSAKACKMAYWKDDMVRKVLPIMALKNVKFFESGPTKGWAAIATDNSSIVVSFRGTNNLGNWITDLDFIGSEKSKLGNVHPGFYKAFQSIRDKMYAAITALDPDKKVPILFTGHSLGGSLATLAAAELPDPTRIFRICTYGQPRTGYFEFRENFNALFGNKLHRFVNDDDLVARLPPAGLAYHVGQLIWFDPQGQPNVHAPNAVRGGWGRSDQAPPAPVSIGEYDTLVADIQDAKAEHRTRSATLAEPVAMEEEQAQQLRGEIPGIPDHMIDRYIEHIRPHVDSDGYKIGEGSVEVIAEPQSIRSEPILLSSPVNGPSQIQDPIPAEEVPDVPPTGVAVDHVENGGDPDSVLEKEPSTFPPLSVHILWSADSDEDGKCPQIASSLYHFLSQKPVRMPAKKELEEQHEWKDELSLEARVGVPTFAGHHFATVERLADDYKEAKNSDALLHIIWLLHSSGDDDQSFIDHIERMLQSALSAPNIRILPVTVDQCELYIPLQNILPPAISASDDFEEKRDRITWQVALDLCRFLTGELDDEKAKVKQKVFISYATADDTGGLAKIIKDHFEERQLNTFLDQYSLVPGKELQRQLEKAAEEATLLAIRSDSYSDSPYCLQEILHAKRLGVPVVSLSCLSLGELRSTPYGGNCHTIGASPSVRELDKLGLISLQALLHHLYFHRAVPLLEKRWGLDEKAIVLSRAPELVDCTQRGLVDPKRSSLVIYPDPPINRFEAQLIQGLFPRVRLATPSTLQSEILGRNPLDPFRDLLIALSLSNSPELEEVLSEDDHAWKGDPTSGLILENLNDAIAYLTLALVRCGASLGYGGHLEVTGFTRLISQLVEGHRRTQQKSERMLTSYVAAHLSRSKPPEIKTQLKEVYRDGKLKKETSVEKAETDTEKACEFSAMRRSMARDSTARAVLGGRILPKGAFVPDPTKSERKDPGFAGRFPGQAEEAYQHLRQNKPIYVIGGFKGSSQMVALALQGKIDQLPTDGSYKANNPTYENLCKEFAPYTEEYGLPTTLDDLWAYFAEAGKGYFHGTEDNGIGDSLWKVNGKMANGLTVNENLLLFESTQPFEIGALVTKGLETWITENTRDERPLNIDLFNGPITEVGKIDGYGVMILKNSPLRGVDGELDRCLGGTLRNHLAQKGSHSSRSCSIIDSDLEGDWIVPYLVDDFKGRTSGLSGESLIEYFTNTIEAGIDNIIEKAKGRGMRSIALVPFGTKLGLPPEISVRAMIKALYVSRNRHKSPLELVTICELNKDTYHAIEQHTLALCEEKEWEGNLLCEILPESARAVAHHAISLNVQCPEDGVMQNQIEVFAHMRQANTSVHPLPFDWNDLFERSYPPERLGRAPSMSAQREFGLSLANQLLPNVKELIRKHPSRPLDVLHDFPCSSIPFEMLCFESDSGDIWPAKDSGLRRTLVSKGDDQIPLYQRGQGALRLLLIVDPKCDLDSAFEEGIAIFQKLDGRDDLELTVLAGDPDAFNKRLSTPVAQLATRGVVMKCMEDPEGYDFIHYAGHGFYNERNSEQSGLRFSDGDLTGALLREKRSKIPRPPCLVFLNACEVGRLAAMPFPLAGSLASAILGSGVAAYVANQWTVGDSAAGEFAISVYEEIITSRPLGDAIVRARKKLFKKGDCDWANYVFYGNPDIIL